MNGLENPQEMLKVMNQWVFYRWDKIRMRYDWALEALKPFFCNPSCFEYLIEKIQIPVVF